MDADRPLVLSLNDPAAGLAPLVGGKAANLARLIAAGVRVPAGFVVTVDAYERFAAEAELGPVIRMELGRKAADDMRWEELWDAALLYWRELALDAATSVMAVVVQEVVVADRSGVAFGRHPTKPDSMLVVVEAVSWPCQLLVDGVVEPDRWELDRTSGCVTEWVPGNREDGVATPLLEPPDLGAILHMLSDVEERFGWPPDMEWTGRHDRLTVLQARPITMSRPDPGDRRPWYLTLTPSDARLRSLRTLVADELIPELESEGDRMAAEDLAALSDAVLADAVDERCAALAALALELIRRPALRAATTELLEAAGRQQISCGRR